MGPSAGKPHAEAHRKFFKPNLCCILRKSRLVNTILTLGTFFSIENINKVTFIVFLSKFILKLNLNYAAIYVIFC